MGAREQAGSRHGRSGENSRLSGERRRLRRGRADCRTLVPGGAPRNIKTIVFALVDPRMKIEIEVTLRRKQDAVMLREVEARAV